MGVLLRCANYSAMGLCANQAYKHANLAGLNAGVVSSIFSCHVFVAAVAVFLLFGEQIRPSHCFAMLLAVIGINCIALSGGASEGGRVSKNSDLMLTIVFSFL